MTLILLNSLASPLATTKILCLNPLNYRYFPQERELVLVFVFLMFVLNSSVSSIWYVLYLSSWTKLPFINFHSPSKKLFKLCPEKLLELTGDKDKTEKAK